jgi:hypothetical protein
MSLIKINQEKLTAIQNEEIDALRKAAYTAESDPILFKALRNEATMTEWQEKVNEIKQRYPR